MKDVRQSDQFASFMRSIGWEVRKIGQQYIYLRKFPVIGYFAKIPRPAKYFSDEKLSEFKRKNKIFRLKISPFSEAHDEDYIKIKEKLITDGFTVDADPFNPTTTIIIDLTVSEEKLFHNFTSAKRRAVRRALKNKLHIRSSDDIDEFIEIRKSQYKPFGFLVVSEMKKLWENFYPENASLLLAYSPGHKKPLAGILQLFYDKVSYYWFASSLALGKKLFAPTLLVWEALKLAKRRGCTLFDFEGIYDDRFPKAAASWRGFTKFKEGFGGEKVFFMENFKK